MIIAGEPTATGGHNISADILSTEGDNIEQIEPAKMLNTGQKICAGALWAVLAFLVGFIIYISCTWDKDRTNEYS